MIRPLCGILLVAAAASGAPTDENTTSHDRQQAATGQGLVFAESCQDKLYAWRESSASYGSAYGTTSTSIFSTEVSVTSYEPDNPTITSLITLCDGHPRVVGQMTTRNASSTTYDTAWTNVNPVFVPKPYPTPQPCSIGPDDCELLYSSWNSRWDSITRNTPDFSEGLLNPPCETYMAPNPSFSTNANGETCNNCQIQGHEIRLLFWPVTTGSESGDICGNEAETITESTGPSRTFVTEGITITSPTIAMSIGGLSRVDDCGITVPHTIIPVLPEDVTSVEGARALYTHRSFNFADLNYKCLDDPGKEFITTGSRTDCYREVPASAYFFGFQNAAGAHWWDPDAFTNSTIWPNYEPQVLPPATLTAAIRSLWGPGCDIHPNGIWDPPIALQQEDSFPLPDYVPGAPTSYYTPHTEAPQPGGPTTPHPARPTDIGNPPAEAQHDTMVSQPTVPGESESHGSGEHGSGDWDEHDGGNDISTGHEVVRTTIITHTSAASSGNFANSEPIDGQSEQVVTATVVTASSADTQSHSGSSQSDHGAADNESTTAHDGQTESQETCGGQPSTTTSVLTTDEVECPPNEGSVADASSTASPSVDDESSISPTSSSDNDISSAIQSGIDGDGGDDSISARPQANTAASVATSIYSHWCFMAVAISVFQ